MRTWSRFAFLRAIFCNGMLISTRTIHIWGEYIHGGLSKDVRGSIADADLEIVIGVCRVS
jgi:hypothetical protein